MAIDRTAAGNTPPFASLYDTIAEPIVVLRTEGDILRFAYGNPGAPRIGFEPGWAGRAVESISSVEASWLRENCEAALAENGPRSFPCVLETDLGRRLTSVSVRPLSWPGSPESYILLTEAPESRIEQRDELIIALDAIVQSELSRRESERRYRSLMHNPIIPIAYFDIEGRFVEANRSAERLLGAPSRRLVGRDFASFLDDERERERIGAYFRRAAQGASQELEATLPGRCGERERVLSLSFLPIANEDGVSGVYGIAKDITEERRREHERRRNEKQLRTIMENNPDFVVLKDGEGRWLQGNQKALRVFRLENIEYAGKTDRELGELQPMYRPMFLRCSNTDRIAWEKGQPCVTEERIPHADGTEHAWEVVKCPLFDESGNRYALVVSGRDVTERKKHDDLLEQSKMVVENSPAVLFRWRADAGWTVEFVSDNVEEQFGYPKDELYGISYVRFIHPDDQARVKAEVRGNIERGEDRFLLEYRICDRQGRHRWVEERTVMERDENGNVTHLQGFILDVGERKAAEQALVESEERYRLITENSVDLLQILDTDGRVQFVSPSFRRVLGYAQEELLADSFARILHPDDRSHAERHFRRIDKFTRPFSFEVRVCHRDGRPVWVEVNCSPVRGESGRVEKIILVAREISVRKQYEEQLKRLAYYDVLTGAPNRRLFHEEMAKTIARSKRLRTGFAVCYMDCDRFKFINDTMGHDIGDELLRQFTGRVRSCLREEDRLYRLGGDEFVAVLTDLSDPQQIADAAKRILNALRKPWNIRDREFVTTSSIGISVFPGDGEDTQTLLKHADMALYQAKSSGKNMFRIFDEEIGDRSEHQLAMETALLVALERNELTLYYQPMQELGQNRITGAEALLRWNHPQHGLIGPDRFIPIAERNGMIFELTRWVLRTACEQSREWRRRGLPSQVSVNISAHHFHRKDLVEMVKDAVERSGVLPRDLTLEITESAIVEDLDLAVETIGRLKEMDVRISIDDFGTGFSSLFYLKKLPVDTIKIDRSFIQDLPSNDRDRSIVAFIIQLANMLELKVVAEGVETGEHRDILRGLKCHLVQGYLISRPAPREQFERVVLG